jgi:hypothetical protein
MATDGWVPWALLQQIVKHTIGAGAIMVALKALKVLAGFTLHGWLASVATAADDFCFLIVTAWLVIELVMDLWRSRSW